MRPMKSGRFAVMLIGIFVGAFATSDLSPAAPETARTQAPGTRAVKPEIGALAWMAGTWTGETEGVFQEEHWMEPRGGLMLALHRDTRSQGRVFFEFLRIEEREDGLYYMASPLGREATPFKMVALEPRKVVFENPEHDFPQKIIYWAEGEETLRARVEGTNQGQFGFEEYAWKRAN